MRNAYGQKFRLRKFCDADAGGKMRTPPLVQHVCIDAMIQREADYRNAWLAGGDRQPFLEIDVVIVPTLPAACLYACVQSGPHYYLVGTTLACQ